MYYVLCVMFYNKHTHNTCSCNYMKLRHSTICTLYSPTHTHNMRNQMYKAQYAFNMSMIMCPAVHMATRSLLRSSSTHEPSDPLSRVMMFNYYYYIFNHNIIILYSTFIKHKK